MKTGRTLQEIAQELERQVNTRKDYVAPQGAIEAKVVEGDIVLDGLNGSALQVTNHAHMQFADHLGIPKAYYDRMRAEQPQLLATNLNTWLQSNGNEKRMVRTLDGKARAFLSDKFRPLDNFDLANAVLPALLENDVQVMSAELTETRLYIKGILPKLSEELPEGMTWGHGHGMVGRDGRLVSALVISNSEVGAGSVRVEPSVFTTWCTNLAILKQAAMRKYHVGRAFSMDEGYEVFSDKTRKADDAAFWLKVKDVTLAAFNPDIFKAAIASIRDAGKEPIQSTNLAKVVEVTVKKFGLSGGAQNSILNHLARGGDLTKWGLSSAVTATANDFDTYEGATALERAGGEIITLPPSAWKVIATAKDDEAQA